MHHSIWKILFVLGAVWRGTKWDKNFGPAQNILWPVKGQGIKVQDSFVFLRYLGCIILSQGWHFDPSLRVECFDRMQSEDCCPTIEVTSNSYGATFFPQLMGTYMMSNDYQVSGRRIYQSQNDNNFLVYLHDWGPRAGMEWTFAPRLGTFHILREHLQKSN